MPRGADLRNLIYFVAKKIRKSEMRCHLIICPVVESNCHFSCYIVKQRSIGDVVKHFTLEYWIDDGWYVGRLMEVPGAFSQGESLEELEENIRDAYYLMVAEEGVKPRPDALTKEIGIET